MEVIYLDNNATTKPAPEVREAINEAMHELWANPSSLHRAGQRVRQKLDLARESVAHLIGCRDRDLVFTSGGTESNNLAIRGSLLAQPDRRVVVTTRVEHSSVRELAGRLSAEGVEVTWLPNDENGLVDVEFLTEILAHRANEIALVSVMWVNNETGVIQPIERIGALCDKCGVRFHTDATQRVGKARVDASSLPIDLLTFAAHKFHGPKGVGGLYVKPRTRIVPQTIGGPQERQRRGGTENVPGILGLGAAAELAIRWLKTNEPDRRTALRDRFEALIRKKIEETFVNGAGAPRQWNTSNVAFAGLEAETVLMMLSERGVCASGGSACASGSLEPSAVLQAMGIPPERTSGSIRFSFSRETTADEIDRAVPIICDVVNCLRESACVRSAQPA